VTVAANEQHRWQKVGVAGSAGLSGRCHRCLRSLLLLLLCLSLGVHRLDQNAVLHLALIRVHARLRLVDHLPEVALADVLAERADRLLQLGERDDAGLQESETERNNDVRMWDPADRSSLQRPVAVASSHRIRDGRWRHQRSTSRRRVELRLRELRLPTLVDADLLRDEVAGVAVELVRLASSWSSTAAGTRQAPAAAPSSLSPTHPHPLTWSDCPLPHNSSRVLAVPQLADLAGVDRLALLAQLTLDLGLGVAAGLQQERGAAAQPSAWHLQSLCELDGRTAAESQCGCHGP
jgi:hypothetical protein